MTTPQIAQRDADALLRAARLPGVVQVYRWPDGAEFCGSPADSDDVAAFITGDFPADQLRCLLYPLPVEDMEDD